MRTITIACAVGVALTASMLSTEASPRRGGQQQFHQYMLPQKSPFRQVEQELHIATWRLSQVNSRRDAEQAARELGPRVQLLERQLNFDRARRSLSRSEYNNLVSSARLLDQHIARIEANRFFGSRNLASVSQRLRGITQSVVPQRPVYRQGIALPALLPPPPVLIPRR